MQRLSGFLGKPKNVECYEQIASVCSDRHRAPRGIQYFFSAGWPPRNPAFRQTLRFPRFLEPSVPCVAVGELLEQEVVEFWILRNILCLVRSYNYCWRIPSEFPRNHRSHNSAVPIRSPAQSLLRPEAGVREGGGSGPAGPTILPLRVSPRIYNKYDLFPFIFKSFSWGRKVPDPPFPYGPP